MNNGGEYRKEVEAKNVPLQWITAIRNKGSLAVKRVYTITNYQARTNINARNGESKR